MAILKDPTLNAQALLVALEALSRPALLVDDTGEIQFANAAGRHAQEHGGPALGDRVRAALQPAASPSAFAVTPIRSRGMPPYYMLIAHPESPLQERIAAAAIRWGLTHRQSQVLALVATGATNREVALKLECTEHTVELHVGAILTKSRAETRTALVAQLWMGG